VGSTVFKGEKKEEKGKERVWAKKRDRGMSQKDIKGGEKSYRRWIVGPR